MNTLDPYGVEYNDWEDPEVHGFCVGCPLCWSWEGHTYEQIRASRRAAVKNRRTAEGGPSTPAEAHRQDEAYWAALADQD